MPATPPEDTILIEPEKRWLGQNFVFKRERDGTTIGRFTLHIGKPNTFEGEGLRLDLGMEGVLQPRFFAYHHRGLEAAALTHHMLTGRLKVEARGKPTLRVERRGLLLPELVVSTDHDDAVVLNTKTTQLLGREFEATLHPVEGWSRQDILALLALVFHAKVSLTILYTAFGGTGVLAPI